VNLHAKNDREYPAEVLCKLFGVTKQAYDKYDENAVLRKAGREAFVLQYIRGIRVKDPGMGGMKLRYMYRKEFGSNNPVGRDRFEDIVVGYGLKVMARVRKPKTTDSTHGLPVYPNIIRDFIPVAPNQLWVCDITYITIRLDKYTYVFCYLSLIPDAYTEEIVGWSVSSTLEAAHPIEALGKALKRMGGQANINLKAKLEKKLKTETNASVRENLILQSKGYIQEMLNMPCVKEMDEEYRRMKYVSGSPTTGKD
jgi:hypothetical protein